MSDAGADLAVIIPTRDRWSILSRTLSALARQTVGGFETIVVVDGTDQDLPALDPARVVVKERGGPGAARNTGARSTDRPRLLFLGDDMVTTPHLVEHHLRAAADHSGTEVGVLGLVKWHPEVEHDRILRWLDWSSTQFDYRNITGQEAGFGRFYSCNVSVPRRLFLDAGGFDESFTYYYEDLDCGWRLDQKGMRLIYEPLALAHHLHRYELEDLERRFAGIAEGERRMAEKHAWFIPFFASRVSSAVEEGPVSPVWPRLVDTVPARLGPVRRLAEQRANRWYYRRLAGPFMAAWEGERSLAELREYLGDRYDHARLVGHRDHVDKEEDELGDEQLFYRSSEAYLYDLTAFALSGTKEPYLLDLRAVIGPGRRLLDYGCGIGSDGLRLLDAGYQVEFADFDNPSTRYLRWRLAHRGLTAPVHDIDKGGVPGGFDLAYAFDVIEHVEDPFAFLAELESRARFVMVNLLEPDPDDTHLHRPLPIRPLLQRAAQRGIIRYRRHHGRSHVVIYRSDREGVGRRARSTVELAIGGLLDRVAR